MGLEKIRICVLPSFMGRHRRASRQFLVPFEVCHHEFTLEKTVMLGKMEGKRRKGRRRIKWLNGIINSMDVSLRKLWEILKDREAWGAAIHGVTKTWK